MDINKSENDKIQKSFYFEESNNMKASERVRC